MITLYSGTPGSGKSYHVAQYVYNALRYRNVRILSNCEYDFSGTRCHSERYNYIDIRDFTVDACTQFCVESIRLSGGKIREGMSLIIIDEAQLLYNARNWQQTDKAGWLQFYSQHRKYGCDIILISQSDGMLDKQIRSLIEYNIIHRKVSRFGLRGFLLSLFLGSFVCVETWYGMHIKVTSYFLRYSKKVAKLYNTYKVWTLLA